MNWLNLIGMIFILVGVYLNFLGYEARLNEKLNTPDEGLMFLPYKFENSNSHFNGGDKAPDEFRFLISKKYFDEQMKKIKEEEPK